MKGITLISAEFLDRYYEPSATPKVTLALRRCGADVIRHARVIDGNLATTPTAICGDRNWPVECAMTVRTLRHSEIMPAADRKITRYQRNQPLVTGGGRQIRPNVRQRRDRNFDSYRSEPQNPERAMPRRVSGALLFDQFGSRHILEVAPGGWTLKAGIIRRVWLRGHFPIIILDHPFSGVVRVNSWD